MRWPRIGVRTPFEEILCGDAAFLTCSCICWRSDIPMLIFLFGTSTIVNMQVQYAVYTLNTWDVPKCPFAKVTPHYSQRSDSHTHTQSRTGTQFERTYWYLKIRIHFRGRPNFFYAGPAWTGHLPWKHCIRWCFANFFSVIASGFGIGPWSPSSASSDTQTDGLPPTCLAGKKSTV